MLTENIRLKYRNNPMFYRFAQTLFHYLMDGHITRAEIEDAIEILDELIANARAHGIEPKHKKTQEEIQAEIIERQNSLSPLWVVPKAWE